MALPPPQAPVKPTELNRVFRSMVDHVQYLMVNWRVFPVMLLFFWMKLSFDIIDWIKANPTVDPIGAAAVLAATVGSAAAYFKFYVETGPNGKFDNGPRLEAPPKE